jgi:cbb3-type cytochrome oxidase subunit 3
MSGTIVFFTLFVVLAARTYTRAQRDAATVARELPLADDEIHGGRR